ncbi:MAG: LacI family transcriptional regulator [Anaerolineae bacterium]|jgi:LacI family transcriptional regulator|nr:LacI family transcriptional regulator [Anaerolineae bacterium]
MNTRRVNISDVAREAGVSSQTVSRALNNKGEISVETRQRVLEIVRRLGYRPNTLARGLVTQKTCTLGLVVPDIANPFFSEVARGAEDAAHFAGYSLLLCNAMEDPEREMEALRTLEAQRVDGILLCSSRLAAPKLEALLGRLPPVVLANREPASEAMHSVSIDDEFGALAAMRHLLRSGRRQVGLLAGPPASSSGARRTAGHRAALAEAGLPARPELIVPCAPHLEGGVEGATALLTRYPEIDALLCYNDLVAVGALQACAGLDRRVPEDVAVVGFDDIPLAALVTPPLTTLRSDRRMLGAELVRLMLQALEGCPGGCENVVLKPELIVRASAPSASAA